MLPYMERSSATYCPHVGGLRAVPGGGSACPDCGARLDAGEVAGWVREAEECRDAAGEAGGLSEGGWQREVYRRRKVMYELQSRPWASAKRPEMILVCYDLRRGVYDCRVFYKEPRPVLGLECLSVEATAESIRELHGHADPNARLVSEKLEEFHELRREVSEGGGTAPQRRVFYAGEL